MTLAKTGGPNYDARIRRAQHLAAIHPFASEVMKFYQHLALFQQRLYNRLMPSTNQHPTPAVASDFRSNLDLAQLLQHFPELLSLLQNVGPTSVAESARQFSLPGPAAWISFLTEYWTVAGTSTHLRRPQHSAQDAQDAATQNAPHS
jgi:hypothetical protein